MGALAELFSHTSLAWVVALGLFAFTLRQIQSWYRLRHIPGPRLAGFTAGWQVIGALSGRYHEWLTAASEQYGPLVRIGPNELICTDPDVLRRISSVRSTYTKGAFYDSARLVPGVDNVVSERDEEKHKAMRAKLTPAYSASNHDGGSRFEAAMNRQLLNFIHLIESKYISTNHKPLPVDMAEKTQFFALDAISDISLGAPFGYLDKDEDLYDYNTINRSALPIVNMISVLPWLGHLLHQWPFRLALPRDGDRIGFGRLMGLAQSIVRHRLASDKAPVQDMMQVHINNGLTEEELIQHVFVSIIAGSNSAAQVLRMIILALVANPRSCAAFRQEIRKASSTVQSPISWNETQTLPYLQGVVSEGLRLFPSVAGLGFKQVPREGDTIHGYFIPGGTVVGQAFHGVGRSKAFWGSDADIFRPERWLEAQGDRLTSMKAAVDTNFGAGKYSCLGKPIGLMELHKAVFELFKRYDFAVINPEQPIKITSSIFLFASDFWVTITRQQKENSQV